MRTAENAPSLAREGSWVRLLFEWDEEKAKTNLKKHKVDFDDAMRVFEDVNRLEFYDEAHSRGEERYNTIGMVRDILFVVYTERREYIRIISARKANRREERLYEERKRYP